MTKRQRKLVAGARVRAQAALANIRGGMAEEGDNSDMSPRDISDALDCAVSALSAAETNLAEAVAILRELE